MKIKCINIYNEYTRQYEKLHHQLTIGREYIVLEMEIYLNKILYRLIGDNSEQSPALYNASQFEIVSGKIASNWNIHQLKSGALICGPESWQSLGFWEGCYEGDLAFLNLYKSEAKIILEEENGL